MLQNAFSKIILCRNFPGGTVDKNLPVNAWDVGSIPGRGRPNMPRSKEAVHHNYGACALEPMFHDKRNLSKEEPEHGNKLQSQLAASRQSPSTATKTQHSRKLIN